MCFWTWTGKKDPSYLAQIQLTNQLSSLVWVKDGINLFVIVFVQKLSWKSPGPQLGFQGALVQQERPCPKWPLACQIKSMRNQRQWITSELGWASRQNRLPALSLNVTMFTSRVDVSPFQLQNFFAHLSFHALLLSLYLFWHKEIWAHTISVAYSFLWFKN